MREAVLDFLTTSTLSSRPGGPRSNVMRTLLYGLCRRNPVGAFHMGGEPRRPVFAEPGAPESRLWRFLRPPPSQGLG